MVSLSTASPATSTPTSSPLTRSLADVARRHPLRHPAHALVFPLLLAAAVARAPQDPVVAAALVGTSAALFILRYPERSEAFGLEIGLLGHLVLALIVSSWPVAGRLTSPYLEPAAVRMLMACAGSAAVLMSLIDAMAPRRRRSTSVSPDALGPLQPFFSQVAETLEQLASEVESTEVPHTDAAVRAIRRARTHSNQLQNISIVTRNRPLADGVGPVVASVMKALDPETMPFAAGNVRVHRESSVGEVMARVPAPYLELMFWNLANNAYTACAGQDNRTIRVSVQRDGKLIVVELRDDGTGLSEHELSTAFCPMSSPKPGHLHLGLCAARRLAEAYGGSLEVESKRGQGTTVVVRLPAARN